MEGSEIPDMFEGNSAPSTQNDEIDDILGLGFNDSNSSGNGILNHSFAKQNPNDFVTEQTVNLDSEANELSLSSSQDSKWKTLIPGNATDGTIYEDENIKINMKFNISKYLTRVLIEYVSNSASSLENIEARLKVPEGMKASVSPTKYPSNETDNPKSMLMVMATGNIKEELKMAIQFESGFGGTEKIIFKIPVLINKFIERVEMDQDRFDHLWHDISKNRPNSFEKLDIIMKNPACGSSASQMDVLKKLAKLLSM